MGKGNWFSAVKKALSPQTKENKDQKTRKPKKKWFGKNKDSHPVDSSSVEATMHVPPPAPPVDDDVKLTEAENEQSKHAYSVALATAVAAEAAVAAAQAAAEIVRLTSVPRFLGKSKEEIAAIKIQTAFRGYMARRALRALRGLVRLKSLIQGQSVKRQATTTLRCMQTMARVQSQIRDRRIKMSEENQALQIQIQQKQERELEKLRASMGDDWDDSMQSKESVDANLQRRQEAAMRREKALAYAFSHQRKNSSKSINLTFMDPTNPHWGWSWLERWMAARPWESRTTLDHNSDRASIKSTTSRALSIGEISKAYKMSHQSPSTPHSKAPSVTSSSYSVQTDRYRRHSIAGSSVRDDESLGSSPLVPSYMAPTQSAKAKSRVPSPLGLGNGTTDKGSVGSVKKRLSFTGSPGVGMRRHSGPPKVDMTLVKVGSAARTEDNMSNGGKQIV